MQFGWQYYYPIMHFKTNGTNQGLHIYQHAHLLFRHATPNSLESRHGSAESKNWLIPAVKRTAGR